MNIEWMGKYREFIEKLIKFGNSYAQHYSTEKYFGTPVPLSALQLHIMEYILENEEKNQKMVDIAKLLGISPSTLTKHVKRLTERGLLEKYHLGDNRKDVIVKVSDAGKQCYESYSKYIYKEVFQPIFQEFNNISEEDLQRFTGIMDLACKMSGETEAEPADKSEESPALIRIE